MSFEAPVVGPVVDERLVEGAPIQWQLAQQQCRDGCAWYHGPRLYLRALGIQVAIRRDSGFLLEAFERLARQRSFTRVLISGAADCGTLAHLSAAYVAAGAPLRVTMVDQCATPLGVNTWYASQVGVPFETHQGSILDFHSDEPFDLVCTHGFLGSFDPAARRRLLVRWHALLRPGGAVVTTASLRPNRFEPVARFDDAETQALRTRARHSADEARRLFNLDAGTVEAWTETFAERKTYHPTHTAAEVQDVFEQAGFRCDVLQTADGMSGADAKRLRVVAERIDDGLDRVR